jgi:hypothetical protein
MRRTIATPFSPHFGGTRVFELYLSHFTSPVVIIVGGDGSSILFVCVFLLQGIHLIFITVL